MGSVVVGRSPRAIGRGVGGLAAVRSAEAVAVAETALDVPECRVWCVIVHRTRLTAAHEGISDRGRTRLRGLLDAGDPHGEVRTAWYAKRPVGGIYGIDSPAANVDLVLVTGWTRSAV